MTIVGGYHHVHIISPDPEAAAEWFVKFFGAEIVLREEPRGAKNVMTKIGDATLSVRTPRPTDRLIETGGGKPFGLDHICFLVDDLHAMVENMRANGVEIAEEIFDHSGGSEAAFIVGPENVLFELIQAK
ncbi:MAG: VOC family protein [bacterium]